jgi:hypothetical protein
VVCKIDDVEVESEEVYWEDTSSEEEEEEDDEEPLPPPPPPLSSGDKPQSTSKLGLSFVKPAPTTTRPTTTKKTKKSKQPKPIINEGENQKIKQGYIGMLSVDPNLRRLGIGGELLGLGIGSMVASVKGRSSSFKSLTNDVTTGNDHRTINKGYSCHRVSLEAETTNLGALRQYEAFGFQKVDYLQNYYLNMGDAVRLVLYVSREEDRGGLIE